MRTKTVTIKGNTRRFRVWLKLNEGNVPTSAPEYYFVWFAVSVFMAMGVVVMAFVGVILAAAVSPLLHHYWPDNGFVTYLRGRPWHMVVIVFRFWVGVLVIATPLYALRARFIRLGHRFLHWVTMLDFSNLRPIEIVED